MHEALRRRFHLIAAAVGLAAAVASTWPVAAHLVDHVVDGGQLSGQDPASWTAKNLRADVLQTVWIVSWELHALVSAPLHLFDANIFYPSPLSLARAEHLFATALLGAPGALLAGPVAAHQTALLLTAFLSTWTTAYVVSRWSGSIVGGIAAGLLFATCPFRQSQLFHLQSLGTAYFPVMLFGLGEFASTGAAWGAAAGGLGLLLQILSGQYLGFFAVVAWLLAGAVAIAIGRPTDRPSRRLIRDALWLAATSALVVLVTLPFVVPYLRVMALGEFPDMKRDYPGILWGASLRSPGQLLTWGRLSHTAIAAPSGALAAIGLADLLRRTRTDRMRALMLVVTGAAGALLALGPGRLYLYDACMTLLPGFRSVREPWRATVLTQLAVAMLAGFGVAALARLGAVARLVAVGAVAASLATYWRVPVPLAPLRVGSAVPGAYQFLARCGEGDPLLELPAYDIAHSWGDAERQFFSTFHWLPLLNGRASFFPRSLNEINALVARIPDASAIATLKARTGVRWVLVHCDETAMKLSHIRELCLDDGLRVSKRRFGNMQLHDLGPSGVLPRKWPPRWKAAPECEQDRGSAATEPEGR